MDNHVINRGLSILMLSCPAPCEKLLEIAPLGHSKVPKLSTTPRKKAFSFQLSAISDRLSGKSYQRSAISSRFLTQPINYLTASPNEPNELHEPSELNRLSIVGSGLSICRVSRCNCPSLQNVYHVLGNSLHHQLIGRRVPEERKYQE